MRLLTILVSMAAFALAAPAAAQLRPLVHPPATTAAAQAGVDVFLINEGGATVAAEGPAEIETVAGDGSRLHLIAAPDEPLAVKPGGFAKVHYRLAGAAPPLAAASAAPAAVPIAPAVAAQAVAPSEQIVQDSSGSSGGFIDRFRQHEPIYGVAGLQDSGAKLQFSFAFRALGHAAGPSLSFGYTQTMFWAIDRSSGPIRATNYSPEIFAELPIGRATTLGLGYRHDSDGLGDIGSVDVNRIIARASHRTPVGGGWTLDLTPEAWFYVGQRQTAPDLDRYRGYTALTAAIRRADGIKLSVMGRGNPSTGKGAAEAFLSYPLAQIWDDLPHIYLFGEVFTGYGEALSDYRKRDSHARLGIAFTR